MPFRCRSRQRVQKFSSSSRYVDPSFFHVLFNETSPTIEYPTVKMLFIIEHSASTFYVSFPPSNPSSRIIIRFCSRTPPLWNLLPRSTLFLVDNSLFFFLPHFSANWRNLGNSNFLASIRSLISMILRLREESSSMQIDLKIFRKTYETLIHRYSSLILQFCNNFSLDFLSFSKYYTP